MSRVLQRIEAMGLTLPPGPSAPPGIVLPFPWVNVRGDRVFVSGHGPEGPDGAVAGPFGQVGREVSLDDAVRLARVTALSMLGSLQRELGDLDRIAGWGRVFGMVNSAPGFDRQPTVINGFSELILAAFGDEVGRHSRSAVGMAGLPFNMAVEIEAEVLIRR